MPWVNPWNRINENKTSVVPSFFNNSPIRPDGQGGSIIYGKSYNFPSWAIVGTALPYVFYVSLFLFTLFLILTFAHYTVYPIFSFSPNDNGFIPIPTASDRQIAYTKSPAAADLSANFINVPASSYTIGMDVYLTGIFQPSDIPRVLLYRSKNKVTLPNSPSNISTMFNETNFMIWLDPLKNDLNVGATTTYKIGTPPTVQNIDRVESALIENVPVKKVFRVTVVFTDTFLEVYINGKLESTKPLSQTLKSVADTAKFYPVITEAIPSVQISNLAFWPRILSAREVQAWGSPMSNEAFYPSK
jgi:hypothetical protein